MTINGRDHDRLIAARDSIRERFPAASIDVVAADLTAKAGRSIILTALPEVDVLVTNNAGPAPGTLDDWDEAALAAALQLTTVPALELIRGYLPAMRARGFGRIVNITSAMVKAPQYELGLSAGMRAALTAISKAISREVAADGVTINNLLPERIDSPRQQQMIDRLAAAAEVTPEEARRRTTAGVAAKRLGRLDEVGDACAFLCSVQAGYISGQNLQLDGGSYGGLL